MKRRIEVLSVVTVEEEAAAVGVALRYLDDLTERIQKAAPEAIVVGAIRDMDEGAEQ